ncbi:pectate lyase [Aspergillus pseudonomiae]|uniref:Pectate lyase n=1 Tax=Aspergillus pseudonomiae TaxID=1506151 RepID=A0A5N7DRG6_9EURO|nr:pectate lyase [Aspergillus pseudonomiae]KAB8266110.1 pectate lyase [Aspergillus pseudonomiae]KAE8408976.1 pectate lyase [Aspergillus pseudonomiae]
MLPKAVILSLLASMALGASEFPIPESAGTETFSEPKEIAAGEVFDGGLKTYGRGVECTGQEEGGDSDAVFILQEGATLKNAIIGTDQIEGVHCEGACTIENVWWEKVCEDALSLKKGNGPYKVIGGGAQGAEDKVIQHNAGGEVSIDGFVVSDFGKLFRSCGNCKSQSQRSVTISNVKAYNGKLLAGVNENYGDVATITDTCATSVKKICTFYEGNEGSGEPTEIGSGPSDSCVYTDPLPSC